MKKNNILKFTIFLTILITIILMFLLYLSSIENNGEIQTPIKEVNDIQVKEKYECNEFSMITITTENLVNMYFNDYKNNMLNNQEEAYNSLNLEYREKRFGNLDNYKQYINKNIEKIRQTKIKQYLINNYDGYDEYVCLDQYNNYYIFDVTAVMQYTLNLDTYTIDSQNFINAYDNAGTQEKVMLNIQKIFNAINNKDYEYVYDKLDEEFINNKYQTKENFIDTIQKEFFNDNYVSYDNFKNEGNIYIYNIIVKNKEDTNETKNLTIIMKLLNDRNFVMSYSFN